MSMIPMLIAGAALGALAGASVPATSAFSPNAPSVSNVSNVSAGHVTVVHADKLLMGDGSTVDHGSIVIENGKITAVGAGIDAPAGASVVEHTGWASAGLIALHSYSGSVGEMRDSTRAVLDGHVAVAFDPQHCDFKDALAAGITTIVLTPTPQSLSGGTAAAVKTARGGVLTTDAFLSLGLSEAALANNRFPTSYAGALAELDRRFDAPVGGFAKALDGTLPVMFEVDTRADVQRALELAARRKLKGALHGAEWSGELAEPVKKSGLAVVLGPFDVGTERRTLLSAVELAKHDVALGFGLDVPGYHPEGLRLSAALCLREGLPRAAAW